MNENAQEIIAALNTKVWALENELAGLKAQHKEVWEENLMLKREKMPMTQEGKPRQLRKNGKARTQWGVVMSVVRRSKGMTCKQLSHITGFDRYAIYAAAKRAGIRLKPAND